MTDTSKEAIERMAENLTDWGQHDDGVINDDRDIAAAALRALSAERDVTNACNRGLVRLCEAVQTRAEAAEARVKVLEAAMDRIWDHCQNSGIEHATVGMRVIERVEDEVAAVRKDRSHE